MELVIDDYSWDKSSHSIPRQPEPKKDDFKKLLSVWTKEELQQDLNECESLIKSERFKREYKATHGIMNPMRVHTRIAAIKELIAKN
jgi:hypothetical protein